MSGNEHNCFHNVHAPTIFINSRDMTKFSLDFAQHLVLDSESDSDSFIQSLLINDSDSVKIFSKDNLKVILYLVTHKIVYLIMHLFSKATYMLFIIPSICLHTHVSVTFIQPQGRYKHMWVTLFTSLMLPHYIHTYMHEHVPVHMV